jgi:hypothetical protein
MLRRIALWKYGIAVVFILGCCVCVSHQDQETRDQYEQKCNQLNAVAVSPSSHYEDCDKGAENAARHQPRWYRVFGWPEGITTWAILLTLLSIAEQTIQTKKAARAALVSAKAANDQIQLIKNKERARIAVNIADSSGDNIDEGTWPVKLVIANEGATHAFDALLLVAYIVLPSLDLPDLPPIKSRPIPSTIKADTEYVTGEIQPDVKTAEISMEDVWEGRLFVHLRGAVVYKDVFGDSHGTDFHFVWQVRTKPIASPSERGDAFAFEFSSAWVRPNTQGNAAT